MATIVSHELRTLFDELSSLEQRINEDFEQSTMNLELWDRYDELRAKIDELCDQELRCSEAQNEDARARDNVTRFYVEAPCTLQ